MSLIDVKHRIVPQTDREVRLESLLKDVTSENLHQEVDFGPSIGKEAWYFFDPNETVIPSD